MVVIFLEVTMTIEYHTVKNGRSWESRTIDRLDSDLKKSIDDLLKAMPDQNKEGMPRDNGKVYYKEIIIKI